MLCSQARSLLSMMQLIGALSGRRTVTQVALNWLMAKGAPVFMKCLSPSASTSCLPSRQVLTDSQLLSAACTRIAP